MTIEVNEEHLKFRTMDPSHVALIDAVFSAQSFEKYIVSRPGAFGIRTDELKNMVKTFDKKESLALSINDDSILNVKSKTSSNQLKLIERSATDTPLPKISYNALVSIRCKELKNIIKRIKTGSEYITLNMHDRQLDISGKGDIGESNIVLEKGSPEIPEFDLKENSQANYSIEYIEEFLKCFKDGVVTLQFSERMPLKMTIRINYSQIDYYLAPRVDN